MALQPQSLAGRSWSRSPPYHGPTYHASAIPKQNKNTLYQEKSCPCTQKLSEGPRGSMGALGPPAPDLGGRSSGRPWALGPGSHGPVGAHGARGGISPQYVQQSASHHSTCDHRAVGPPGPMGSRSAADAGTHGPPQASRSRDPWAPMGLNPRTFDFIFHFFIFSIFQFLIFENSP